MMQVVDENGRVIEQRNNIKAESVLNVGTLYRPGIYYIRILQGKEKRELKLIILSD